MKEIRSNFVKESLLDYETLANSLKENPRNIPHYDLAKNSILAKLEKRIQKGGK